MMINLSNVTFVIDGFTLTVEKKDLKKDPLAWYCADCTTEIPFSVLSNKDFKDFLYSTTTPQPLQILENSSKEIKKIMSHFIQLNQLFEQKEGSTSCDCCDVDDINKIVISQNDLTVIYLNISSLALHIDKLKLFLSLIKTKFDIICMP